MNTWLEALARLHQQHQPCVLVTVIEEQGSTPRNAGAKMVVDAAHSHDTIGGGHLEFRAQAIAREMLESGSQQPRLERFALGASLGQCCGGATVLLFEPLGRAPAHIAVFGAGHVARALVPLLAGLGCRVQWIDSREQEFPAQLPAGVERVVSDDPLGEVAEQPAGSYFIVMTHDHQLDLELTEAILRRDDFTWFGLIGSKSKRARFEHRLQQRGLSCARLRCPMGLPQVKGKLPLEIAIAIAGEVIATYNAHFGSTTQSAPAPLLLPTARRRPAAQQAAAVTPPTPKLRG